MSFAIFSASMSKFKNRLAMILFHTLDEIPRDFFLEKLFLLKKPVIKEEGRGWGEAFDSQTTADGCPGGKNGNELASTTRSPVTPLTRALESRTALGSLSLPIAPKGSTKISRQSHVF